MAFPQRLTHSALALALLGGCSDTSDKAPKPNVNSDGNDIGDSSAGSDAGVVITKPDASSDYRACTETAERFHVTSDTPSGASFSMLSKGLDFHVAYLSPTCLGVDGNGKAHGVRYVRLMSTGALTDPADVVYVDGATCTRVQHPALANVDGTLTLAYSAAPSGPWAVYGRQIDAQDGALLSGERVTLSVTSVEAENVASASVTVWSEDDAQRQSAIWAAKTDGSAGEQSIVAADAGYHVTALSLRGFPKVGKSTARAALAFASDSATQTGIFLMTLDGAMKPLTAAVRLSDAHPGAVSLDLQARGVLYTGGTAAAPDLRFRALDEQSRPVGEEVRVTDAGERAAYGSLTPFTVGYAIAYRSVKSDDPLRAWLRLSLIDPQGNIAGYRNLFETSAGGGKVLIRTAVDGRLALAFREVSASGSSELHVARITCGS